MLEEKLDGHPIRHFRIQQKSLSYKRIIKSDT